MARTSVSCVVDMRDDGDVAKLKLKVWFVLY